LSVKETVVSECVSAPVSIEYERNSCEWVCECTCEWKQQSPL